MLKLKIILLIIFFSGITFGQKEIATLPFSMGVNVFPKFSMPRDFGLKDFFSSPNQSPEQGIVNNSKFTIQAGLSGRLMLSNERNFFLSFDLGYLNNGFEAKNINTWVHLVDDEGNINFDEPSWADVSNINHYGFTSLSLGKNLLSFYGDNLHLIGVVGVQGQYLFSSSFHLEHQSETNRQYDYQYIYKGADIIQNYVASMLAEIGLDTRINDNFSLLSNVLGLYDLNGARLVNNNERSYYSIGLKFGVLFDL